LCKPSLFTVFLILCNQTIYDILLVGFADGTDLLSTEFKTVVDLGHLIPYESLARASNKDQEDISVSFHYQLDITVRQLDKRS
jgi:hypothetical protein